MQKPIDLQFLRDAQDLFSGRREGHMGAYLYKDPRLWSALAENDRDYYISRHDNRLLNRSLKGLARAIPAHLGFRDNGPGAGKSVEEKTVRLLKALQSNEYIAVDVSEAFATAACEAVNRYLPDIKTTAEVLDFFRKAKAERSPAVVYFGGSTIGNITHPLDEEFPTIKLATALDGLASQAGDYLIVSFDSNRDESSLMKAYTTEKNSVFVTGLVRRIAVELPNQGFNPAVFSHDPTWNAPGRQMAHFLGVEKDCEFQLGKENFSVKAGERFLGLNSYKPAEDNLIDASDIIGLQPVEFFQDDSTLRIAVLQRPQNANYQMTSSRVNERLAHAAIGAR
jgi:uncharacterized SAM-dependent methyltransferase